MRRIATLLLVLGLPALFYVGCDSAGNESGHAILTGHVVDDATNNPIPNAVIRIRYNPDIREVNDQLVEDFEDSFVEADESGRFEIDLRVETTTEVLLTASKAGYFERSHSVVAIADRTVEVPLFRLPRSTEQVESGTPSNILLRSVSNPQIGVKESGAPEVSQITFQVADSAGNPVSLDNSSMVRFTLGQRPNGGEFIAPSEAPTNANGEVTVNLSSGTRAGTVQILAEATLPDGSVIRSKPVSVAIHGGLPDQAHFSLGPERFNFPGLLRFGIKNPVSVIVGDKYGNPVKPGTAVYFTTSHGVIEGSVFTDAEGGGTVDLISGNPLPPDGVAVVEAETGDENQQRVSSRFPVVFSGPPFVTVSPTTAVLGQTYRLTVTDYNNNPLSAGTTIRVRAEGTKVKAVGHTEVLIEDTVFLDQNGDGDVFDAVDVLRGPGITEFTFRAVEDLNIVETGEPTLETITITVRGPNGGVEIVLTASGNVFTLTDGATVEMEHGRAVIRTTP